jgi:hypothetical protein
MRDDEDLAILVALEARDAADRLAKSDVDRQRKRRRRKRLFDDADRYTRLSAQYGVEVLDGLIAGGWTARAFTRAHSLILDELIYWAEATGECLPACQVLREAERRNLEIWKWEDDRRTLEYRVRFATGGIAPFEPRKSPDHDRPWPDAPPGWAPRRWFRGDIIKALRKLFPGLPLHPLTISVSRALNRERAQARAELATETHGSWEDGKHSDDASTIEPIAERNHPKPQGFWSVKKNTLTQRLVWGDCKWEPCEDEPPPASVLTQHHQRIETIDWPKPIVLPPGVRLRDYWPTAKTWRPDWKTPKLLEEITIPASAAERSVCLEAVLGAEWTAWSRQPGLVVRRSSDGAWFLDNVKHRPPPSRVSRDRRSPIVPCKSRPGAWALKHVETPADELAAKRAECKRRREAAIDGLMSNFGS